MDIALSQHQALCCGHGSRWRCKPFNWRILLKIGVRTFHGTLTIGIILTLFYFRTGLQAAIRAQNYVYLASFFLLALFSLLMYYVSCITDPGFVPIPEDEEYPAFSREDPEEEENFNEEGALIQNDQVPTRDCGFCGCMQPLRARHCEDCERCIRKYDHHCPWLDTCIGEGNHKFFLLFIISTGILSSWGTIIIWQALEFHNGGWSEWLKNNGVLFIDLCITVAVTVILAILGGLHSYLMAINSTTWELISRERITYLKHLDDHLNPFHEGYCCNIYRFLCSRTHRQWDKLYTRNAFSESSTL